MKGLWWKLLGPVIFLYVLIAGMLVPLNPGVTAISPSSANSGEVVTIKVQGYNTHFTTASQNRAWLKLDSIHSVAAIDVKAENDNILQLKFAIPVTFPDNKKAYALNLIIDNEIDGAFVQPSGVFISHNSDQNVFDSAEWTRDRIADLHQKQGIGFPYRNILNETIRNTFFHVALWFAMFILLIVGLYYAVRYLSSGDIQYDTQSAAFNKVAILYGVLGLITGSIWAKFTWNTFWTTDVKLNMTAVAMLIYLAYLVLRGSSSDQDKRAKLSAAYSIFAFLALIPLVFVIPRLTDSLHPGNGGNPALGGEDLDNTLRLFFYPSIVALILLGVWMSQLKIRYEKLNERVMLSDKNSIK
ncbi:MAG: cytochrome c biogenesis protein CcsA [Saprospiraceae bacterium]|nr:cytochrome c biogenesis protein CcsA [Saprospiraceae bacterium]